jgi:hypothetical protein
MFHASHANRSASLRAFFARSADMAIEAPYSDWRDLLDMIPKTAPRGKPLGLGVGIGTPQRVVWSLAHPAAPNQHRWISANRVATSSTADLTRHLNFSACSFSAEART